MTKKEYEIRVFSKFIKKYPRSEYLEYLKSHINDADLDSFIAVQIPDYCDPEMINTMQSCIRTAANPERIRFLVCFQSDDLDELENIKHAHSDVKVVHIPKDNAPGLCAARGICNGMVTDEKYVLHIDSHMRFSDFWDVGLIQQWKDCEDEKAIISAYCPDYQKYLGVEGITSDVYFPNGTNGRIINATHFSNMTVKLRFRASSSFARHTSKPRRGAFISGHFTFGLAEIDKVVPSDPDMYFVADEISMAVRYYTHGYNIYQPAYRMVLHLYGRQSAMSEKLNVKVERFNSSSSTNSKDDRARMEKLFRVVDHKDIELGAYDLGTDRSLEEYLKFAGISFVDKVILNFANCGYFDVEHSDLDLLPSDWMLKHDHEYKMYLASKRKDKTILVMITSYKDPHLLDTIRSLRDNALYPERIHFAICLQDDDEDRRKQLESVKNCKFVQIKPEESRGVSYGYKLIEHFLENEDYVLRTEAHMYAVEGWDDYMISNIENLGEKAVISDWPYPFDYDNPMPKKPKDGKMIAIGRIAQNCLINITYSDKFEVDHPVQGCVAIGNNVFGHSQFMRDCKHDEDMCLNSAEAFITLQLWTHGYTVYHLPKRYLYHYFTDNSKKSDAVRNSRRSELHNMEKRISYPKLRKYIGIVDDSNIKINIEKGYLGIERTVQAFELFAGINFKNGTVTKRAYCGHYLGAAHIDDRIVDQDAMNKFYKEHNYNVHDVMEWNSKGLRNSDEHIVFKNSK